MPFTVTMPKLSPTMEEGTIVKWHKKEGESVASGDVLIEVATDKATVEYNALDGGILRKILVSEGKEAKVNQPIAIFTQTQEESIEGYQPEGISAPSQDLPPKEKEGQTPPPSEHKTPSPPMEAQAVFSPEPPLKNYTFAFPSQELEKRIAASPLAKKLAKEQGLDLTSVQGTGPKGRITSRDLSLAQPSRIPSFGKRVLPSVAPGTYREIPLTPMRKAIAKRLQQAKTFIPHVYVRQEVNVGRLVQIREELKGEGIALSYNDFVIRAVSLALRSYPQVNSGFDAAKQAILQFETIDIAIAVSIEGGLITPIIRHADYKNLGELSVEMKQLAQRARAGKLEPHEYKGGSFTISNMGMAGITEFAAILNPPQSAILAVGGMEPCLRMQQNKVVEGKKMCLTLSVDHRVLDGMDAARFLKEVQRFLESPTLLFIE